MRAVAAAATVAMVELAESAGRELAVILMGLGDSAVRCQLRLRRVIA
jgi:hypothetical protein